MHMATCTNPMHGMHFVTSSACFNLYYAVRTWTVMHMFRVYSIWRTCAWSSCDSWKTMHIESRNWLRLNLQVLQKLCKMTLDSAEYSSASQTMRNDMMMMFLFYIIFFIITVSLCITYNQFAFYYYYYYY